MRGSRFQVPGSRFRFQVLAEDRRSAARRARLDTPHGPVETPCFMPVGTQATVKGIRPEDLEELGAQMVLGNAYHLALRPGHERVKALGGLHRFMGWSGPLLTDSGGFQIYSLAELRSITDDGVSFRNHLDGSRLFLTPERGIEVQTALGADVIMALDECPPSTAPRAEIERAVRRTTAWLERCAAAHRRPDQALFGIVQGGLHEDLRRSHAAEVADFDLPGYAIGGLSVGEGTSEIHDAAGITAAVLPRERPRYLMGVGTPEDLIACVGHGVDLFDCVLPTRTGRTGRLYTGRGFINIKNARHADEDEPIDKDCDCPVCRRFSRAYLRHLYRSNEMLGPVLGTTHNLRFFLRLMERIRAALEAGKFSGFARTLLARRASGGK